MSTELTNTPKTGETDLSTRLGELRQHLTRVLKEIDAVLAGLSMPNKRRARGSPLDHVKEVTAATEKLRTENGDLSAERVAKLYGVSMSRLADWLGRSRQAVAKTPDADSLQQPLEFFERVARLIATMPPDSFRKWLRMPNKSLQGKRPLELMAAKERQVVADLVEDMLTGAPD